NFPSKEGIFMSETNFTTLGVTGMTCAACSNRVEKVLNKMYGVKAQVNLTTEKASIDYDPEKTSIEDISKKIENVVYGVLTEKIKNGGHVILTKQSELQVFGLTCASCSNRNEKVLNKQDRVNHATVNLTTEIESIEYNPGLVDVKSLIDKIKNDGYDAKPKAEAKEKQTYKEKQLKNMKTKLIISVLLSAPLLLTMLVHLFGMSI